MWKQFTVQGNTQYLDIIKQHKTSKHKNDTNRSKLKEE